MRVIKLSAEDDVGFRSLADVEDFFRRTLGQRQPRGKFRITERRIREDGIRRGELLVFSYDTDIVYHARAASGRMENEDSDADVYPYYFCVDVASIRTGHGRLAVLESILQGRGLHHRHIAQAQGWPIIDERGARRQELQQVLEQF